MVKGFLDRVQVDPGIIHAAYDAYDSQPQLPQQLRNPCYDNCNSCHVEDIFHGDYVCYDTYAL